MSTEASLGWVKASLSKALGACVELASAGEMIALRDSKNPDTVLYFTLEEIKAFIHGAKHGEFDHLLPARHASTLSRPAHGITALLRRRATWAGLLLVASAGAGAAASLPDVGGGSQVIAPALVGVLAAAISACPRLSTLLS